MGFNSGRLAIGETVRWYLRSARHPFQKTIIGRYWGLFSSRPWWIRYGRKQVILADLREYIQQKIFFDGYYERELAMWLEVELQPSDVFWDVGANIGAMTLVAAPLCQTVVSFEPEPKTREHLQVNISANRLQNVLVQEFALSEQEGIIQLFPGPEGNSGMNSICGKVSESQAVPVRTVRAETLVNRDGVPRPNVMKIDVEGAEELVLRGAADLLAFEGLRAIVFESREGNGNQPANRDVVALLARQGFRVDVFGQSDPNAADKMNNYLARRVEQ